MALTTGSVIAQLESLPLLSPPDGMTAKEEEKDLKQIYPGIRPGTHRVVTAELEDIFLITLAACSHFEMQKLLAKNQLRRAMMDAERAISARDGRPLAERRIRWQNGYPVPGYSVDSIERIGRS